MLIQEIACPDSLLPASRPSSSFATQSPKKQTFCSRRRAFHPAPDLGLAIELPRVELFLSCPEAAEMINGGARRRECELIKRFGEHLLQITVVTTGASAFAQQSPVSAIDILLAPGG